MNYISTLVTACFCLYIASGTEEISNSNLIESSNVDDAFHGSRIRRAGFNMLRLGRGLQMLRLGKRGIPMLRLGRSVDDTLSDDDLKYLLTLMRNPRQVPLPRYGKDLAFEYMLMNALQNAAYENDDPRLGFGYDLDMASERQIRPPPRPGRYRRSVNTPPDNSDKEHNTDEEKQLLDNDIEALDKYEGERVAKLMRYSKNSEQDDDEKDKRAMKMLRMGRSMRMLRLGKRLDDDDIMSDDDKRALHVLRLGKRPFKMLRLGRGDNEEHRRTLSLLSLGKNQNMTNRDRIMLTKKYISNMK